MSNRQNTDKTYHEKKRAFCRKKIILLALLISVITLSAGATLAHIFIQTKAAANTFTPAEVSCDVDEEFNGSIKTDVKIQNTGSTDAYIRAAIIVTWIDENNNVYAQKPVNDRDYTIKFSDELNSNWLIDKNGFYYCKTPIAPNSETPQLISECKVIDGTEPEGYRLSVEIVASAIQSVPSSVVQEQWGVTVIDGIIVKVAN